MCWWKEIKLDQQNLSTETSCLPAPFSLQAAPTDQEGAGKWRGRHVLGIQGQRERGSKRMCISNIVTPQQPVFTFQSLIVLGNALHKPQVAWCTLLWRATQAPRPRAPTSCRLLEASNLVPDGSCRRLSAPTHAHPKSLPTSLVLRKRCCVLSPLHPSLLFPAWLASWPGAQGTQEGARGEGRETELSRGSSTKRAYHAGQKTFLGHRVPARTPFCWVCPNGMGRCGPPTQQPIPRPHPRFRTWLASGARDAVVGAAVLVVGAGVAVVRVSFGGVAACGAVDAVVLVLVGVERLAVGSRGRRAVAMRGSPRGAVVVGIGGRRLGQSWRFLRWVVHGCRRLERSLEVAGSDAGDPSVKHSCHRSRSAAAVPAAVAAAAAGVVCRAALV